jgi:hypothetical protein
MQTSSSKSEHYDDGKPVAQIDWAAEDRLHMSSLSLDIFKKDVDGNPIWLDAVGDLDAARLRLRQLASVIPSEYFAFDQDIHQIVVSVGRSDSHRLGG